MIRARTLLSLTLALAAWPSGAHAGVEQLAVATTADASSAAVAGTSDGTFAFRVGRVTWRFGDATTGRVATARFPDDTCAAVAATQGAVLVTCAERAAKSTVAPLVLDTRTGTLAPAPGGRFLAQAHYLDIGKTWIFGVYDLGLESGLATFIDRRTGAVVSPPLEPSSRHDLDTTGTPTRLSDADVRPGTRVVARHGAYRLVEHGSSSPSRRHRLELEKNHQLYKVLERRCTPASCAQPGLSGTVAAWVDGSRVRRYDLVSGRRSAAVFRHVVGGLNLVVQPKQLLVTATRADGLARLFRLR